MKKLSSRCRASELNTDIETFYGTLNPIDWDEKGNVVAFGLFTDEERDLIIDRPKKTKKLKRLLGKKVRVTGKIRSSRYGEELLSLQKIFPLKNQSVRRTVQTYLEEFPLHLKLAS